MKFFNRSNRNHVKTLHPVESVAMAKPASAVHYVSMDKKGGGEVATLKPPKTQRCATKRFGVQVALVPFGYNGNELLIPFKKGTRQKAWTVISEVPALAESINETAMRLYEKYIPNQQASIYQVHCFGEARFHRTRWITILYSAIVNLHTNQNGNTVDWFPLGRRPLLTRLEDQMVDAALQELQRTVRHEPLGIYMLPPEFTLLQLQRMYELLLGKSLSKPAFRKKMWGSEILIPLEETVTEGGRSQPKGLYRFNKKKYYELKRKGFFLDL